MGHEMATAAMPALIASLGASSAVLGLIEGLSDGAASFAKLYSGLSSDRLERRKPLAVVGYFVTASAMASFAWATQWWHVLIGRMCGWIARGVRTPVRKVLLTEATTPATYGRAFGLERAMDSAGAVLGPLVALVLLATVAANNNRYLFILTLIVPGMLAALAIGLLVHERPHTPGVEKRWFANIRALPAEFKRFLIGIGLAGLGDYSKTLLILWAAQAWTPRYGAARANLMAILFYVGYNVVYTVCCWLAGLLADRLPKYWVLGVGYLLAVLPAIALVMPGDSLWRNLGRCSVFQASIWAFGETVGKRRLPPQSLPRNTARHGIRPARVRRRTGRRVFERRRRRVVVGISTGGDGLGDCYRAGGRVAADSIQPACTLHAREADAGQNKLQFGDWR